MGFAAGVSFVLLLWVFETGVAGIMTCFEHQELSLVAGLCVNYHTMYMLYLNMKADCK